MRPIKETPEDELDAMLPILPEAEDAVIIEVKEFLELLNKINGGER